MKHKAKGQLGITSSHQHPQSKTTSTSAWTENDVLREALHLERLDTATHSNGNPFAWRGGMAGRHGHACDLRAPA